MPIDFNPNILFVNNNRPVLQNIVNSNFLAYQPIQDTFIKTVQTPSLNDNSLYDGIKIEQKSFGKIEKTGTQAQLFTITNKNGASVSLSSFGATITSIKVPDKNGKLIDVTQGYDSVTPYEKSPVGHAGGTIGRSSGCYRGTNRISVYFKSTYRFESEGICECGERDRSGSVRYRLERTRIEF